jgi:tellurite resistance protein
LTKGNYERLVSQHSRELLEGTVGAIARSAKDDGVDKGTRRERERIIKLLEKLRDSEYAEVMTHDDLVALIKGEN